METPRYAYLDGNAARVTDGDGWWFAGGRWERMPSGAEIAAAKLITKAEFDQMFPKLPPLPARAFT